MDFVVSYRFSHKDFGLRSQIKIRPQRTILMDFVVSYRFSHKDFGLRSQIKIRPQRTIVRLRIILIWRLAKILMTKSVVIIGRHIFSDWSPKFLDLGVSYLYICILLTPLSPLKGGIRSWFLLKSSMLTEGAP